jgi:hypothetical protein
LLRIDVDPVSFENAIDNETRGFLDFVFMMKHAIDREELRDIQGMIVEADDVSAPQKRRLVERLIERYRKAPELSNAPPAGKWVRGIRGVISSVDASKNFVARKRRICGGLNSRH